MDWPALREGEEETGLSGLTLLGPLAPALPEGYPHPREPHLHIDQVSSRSATQATAAGPVSMTDTVWLSRGELAAHPGVPLDTELLGELLFARLGEFAEAARASPATGFRSSLISTDPTRRAVP